MSHLRKNFQVAPERMQPHAHKLLLGLRVIFIVMFLQLERALECAGLVSSYFETHPRDINTVEGGNCTFTCTVSEFDPDTERLSWHVVPDEYPTVISDYFDESTQNKTSMITVSQIRRNEQAFKCVIRGMYDGLFFKTYSSRTATMHIQYFPKNNEIACGSSPLGDLHEGSNLGIWCKVQKGNPSVNLMWKLNRISLFNASFTETNLVAEGEKLTLNQVVYLNQKLHSKTLYCVASSVARVFLNQQISCSVGPLLVRHKPRVVIYRTDLPSPDNYHESKAIELNCIATSYPVEKFYSWSCSPASTLIEFENATSETVELNTKLGGTVVVSCSVTNTEGTSTAEYIISPSTNGVTNAAGIEETPESVSTERPLCENVFIRLNILNESVNWEKFSFEAHLVCFLNCFEETRSTDVLITWFVNRNQVGNNSSFVQNSSSSVTSHLTVNGNFRKDDIINVSCETLSHHGPLRESVILTMLKPPLNAPVGISSPANKTSDGQTVQGNDNDDIHQTDVMTSARYTLDTENAEDKASWLNLNGIKVIVFASVAVFGGLLLTACICALCTVFIFKYLQRFNLNARPSKSFHDPQVPMKCVSCNASQKEVCLGKGTRREVEDDILYEEPLNCYPPPLPSLTTLPVGKEFVGDKLLYGAESSRSSNTSWQSSGSLASSKSFNFPSENSTPSGSSEGDEYALSQFQGDETLCLSESDLSDHDYDNAKIMRMHMLPRSVSFTKLQIENTMAETDFPLPPFP